MSMRERIARAIDPLAWALTAFDLNAADLADYQERHRPDTLRKADAVLDVLAEPDEGMIEAALSPLYVKAGEDWSEAAAHLRQDWSRMIAAARPGA
jgi:hypothetical protein